MKTDDLIRILATDGLTPAVPVRQRLLQLLPLGVVVAAMLFLIALGPRDDIAAAMRDPRFLFKGVVMLLLGASGIGAALRLARPEGHAPLFLLAAPAALLLGIAGELLTMPASSWTGRLVGNNARVCLLSIPLLSLPILAAGLAALRHGAPARPGAAGAVAGVLAGGLAAALYAVHCADDSPLFVATWYTLAIMLVAAAGALLGQRLLRW